MFVAALIFAVRPQIKIDRDPYGVPIIRASSAREAFVKAGYAVAHDRLWQMENSRRVARGRMSEVFGPTNLASDREVAQTGYTDAEIKAQIDHLSPEVREQFVAYSEGVNAYIDESKARGSLPEGYATAGFAPEPWSPIDSAAIAIRLMQYFGGGGAGEIRNMALMAYMKSQKKLAGHELDVLDDFAWFQDPEATCTIPPKDETPGPHPTFPIPTRAETERHIAQLPKLGMLDLLPGIRLAERRESTLVAERVGAPYKVGSYCIVVGPKRSATGRPLLLSGPQMGWQTPSIVHEISYNAPNQQVVGMDVPGLPGVLIGHTKRLAWGLTSGVADVSDVYFYPLEGADAYRYGEESRKFSKVERTIHVKGGDDVKVTQLRTIDGPVVLSSRTAKVAFVKKSSYWGRELQSFELTAGLANAKTADDIDRVAKFATVSFNFFYALSSGDFGYRFLGAFPLRPTGYDPRFPMPAGPNTAWKGEVPFDQAPHVRNPSQGFLANWNNKPISWWANGDTPVWGKAFRNTSLLEALPTGKLHSSDLELAAWTIARRDEAGPYIRPFFDRAIGSKDYFNGWMLAGSPEAAVYQAFGSALTAETFLPFTGNFMSEENFRQIAQTSVLVKALGGKTKFNYLQGRTADDVLAAALARAKSTAQPRYRPGGIGVTGEPPIPYYNRGTYIQVIDFLPTGISGRNVVSPGVSESGPHSRDQAPLARAWTFKQMMLD